MPTESLLSTAAAATAVVSVHAASCEARCASAFEMPSAFPQSLSAKPDRLGVAGANRTRIVHCEDNSEPEFVQVLGALRHVPNGGAPERSKCGNPFSHIKSKRQREEPHVQHQQVHNKTESSKNQVQATSNNDVPDFMTVRANLRPVGNRRISRRSWKRPQGSEHANLGPDGDTSTGQSAKGISSKRPDGDTSTGQSAKGISSESWKRPQGSEQANLRPDGDTSTGQSAKGISSKRPDGDTTTGQSAKGISSKSWKRPQGSEQANLRPDGDTSTGQSAKGISSRSWKRPQGSEHAEDTAKRTVASKPTLLPYASQQNLTVHVRPAQQDLQARRHTNNNVNIPMQTALLSVNEKTNLVKARAAFLNSQQGLSSNDFPREGVSVITEQENNIPLGANTPQRELPGLARLGQKQSAAVSRQDNHQGSTNGSSVTGGEPQQQGPKTTQNGTTTETGRVFRSRVTKHAGYLSNNTTVSLKSCKTIGAKQPRQPLETDASQGPTRVLRKVSCEGTAVAEGGRNQTAATQGTRIAEQGSPAPRPQQTAATRQGTFVVVQRPSPVEPTSATVSSQGTRVAQSEQSTPALNRMGPATRQRAPVIGLSHVRLDCGPAKARGNRSSRVTEPKPELLLSQENCKASSRTRDARQELVEIPGGTHGGRKFRAVKTTHKGFPAELRYYEIAPHEASATALEAVEKLTKGVAVKYGVGPDATVAVTLFLGAPRDAVRINDDLELGALVAAGKVYNVWKTTEASKLQVYAREYRKPLTKEAQQQIEAWRQRRMRRSAKESSEKQRRLNEGAIVDTKDSLYFTDSLVRACYESRRRIGVGGEGHVDAVQNADGEMIAVKVVRKKRPVLVEPWALYALRGVPGVVRWQGHHEIPDEENFVTSIIETELVNGGNLYDWMKATYGADYSPPLRFVREIGKSVMETLQRVHQRGIMHRDIKEENVLLEWDAERLRRVVLGDFGLASARETSTTVVCTIDYAPPELYMQAEELKHMRRYLKRHAPYNNKIDVYSLGVMLYNVYYRQVPRKVPTLQEMSLLPVEKQAAILFCNPRFPPARSNLEKLFQHLLCNMLQPYPENRYTIADCLNHAFIKWDWEPAEQQPYYHQPPQQPIQQPLQNGHIKSIKEKLPQEMLGTTNPQQGKQLKKTRRKWQ